ncbi:MAG: 50S ribosomal protein L15 [Candidatus Edwardsbacteria bacterium]
MKLGELRPAKGAVKKKKRLGCGEGSGHGGTSTKGHKGQKARAGKGSKVPPWFEGGQMPLQRRLPKRGFTSKFRREFQIVNLKELNRCLPQTVITPEVLREKGLIKKLDLPVKILGEGEIKEPLQVQAQAFSKQALEKIEKQGGKAILI